MFFVCSLGTPFWSDNSGVAYTNWAKSEPNSLENNEKCTELYSPSSEWNDVNCQSKRGFICRIKQGNQAEHTICILLSIQFLFQFQF